MSEPFDPYYKWLGIPPRDQPPNHYRLLAIERFEPDREVIDSAANRLMAYLKSLSTGDDATAAQRLLNEVAAARRCLLDAKNKTEYDKQLRNSSARPSKPGEQAPAAPAPAAKAVSASPPQRPASRPKPTAPSPAAPSPAAFDEFLPSLPVAGSGAMRSTRKKMRKPVPLQQRPEFWIAIGGGALLCLIVVIVFAVSLSGNSSDRSVASAPPSNREREKAPRSDSSTQRETKPPALTAPANSSHELVSDRDARRETAEKSPEPIEIPPMPQDAQPLTPTSPVATPAVTAAPAQTPPAKHWDRKHKSWVYSRGPNGAVATAPGGAQSLAPGTRLAAKGDRQSEQDASDGSAALPSPDSPTMSLATTGTGVVSGGTAAGAATVSSSSSAAVPASPLAALGSILELPPFPATPADKSDGAESQTTTTATALGTLKGIKPGDLRLSIDGGTEIFGQSAAVTVSPIDANKPGRWRVELSEHDAKLALAEFFLADDKLQFSWGREALPQRADLLRNCLLQVSLSRDPPAAATERRFLLRSAKSVEPLTIQSNDGGPQTHLLKVAGVPTAAQFQLEVTEVTGPAPYAVVYKEPLTARVGKYIDLQWGEGDAAVYAQVQLESATATAFKISTRLLLQAPNPQNPKMDRAYSSKIAAPNLKKLTAIVAMDPRNNPALAPKMQSNYDRRYPHAAEILAYCQGLEALSTDPKVRNAVRIHFCIYATVGGQRLELVRAEAKPADK